VKFSVPPSAGFRAYLVDLWLAKVLKRNMELAHEFEGKAGELQLIVRHLVVASDEETARGRKRFLLSHQGKWRGGGACGVFFSA